jgi:hypothetical protein
MQQNSETEIILTIRRHEPDGSYSEWTTKPGLLAFTATVRKEIKKLLLGIEK